MTTQRTASHGAVIPETKMNEEKKKTGRGGYRPGAGRKKLYGEDLKLMAVRLPLSVWRLVMEKGGAPWAREVLTREAKK